MVVFGQVTPRAQFFVDVNSLEASGLQSMSKPASVFMKLNIVAANCPCTNYRLTCRDVLHLEPKFTERLPCSVIARLLQLLY